MSAQTKIEEDTYQGPRHDGEYERLRVQHEMIKTLMKGRLVLAPVDLSKPDLAVLDSATADGYWLLDLAQHVAPTATLMGADIAPQRFLNPSELPANVSLFPQNIFDPWPDYAQNAFDLVHQRFVLPVCSDQTSMDVIRNLLVCVKSGGYLMLHDADFDSIEEGEGHEAMERLRDVLRRSWSMIGYNLSPGPKLRGWFEHAGLEDVHEEILHIKVGASADNREDGERPIGVLLAALDGIRVNMGKMSGFFFSDEDFAKLKIDLKKELETNGNCYNTHIVWARKAAEV
ncbi:S-adenosyl-L-methionine-dependent methyltransferase [Massariosphaeria phaeospora]|uniref:S-adenosyl-L-methionine-dependent methyltransferase n=1 Tax=Massariosphaeria phaeospora TaxID=100035 RepID=A0A7C8IHT1_9PLEO|nr:S-adenosyl-L-methionine-dependent methyltransferase [Massariosphaeria phaeospora]